MSFFIKNRTNCKISNEPIASINDAVLLDYVNVQKHPEFAEYTRSYVLRKSFENWELRGRYARATFELILDARQSGHANNVLFADENLVVFDRVDSVSFKDYFHLIELVIEKKELRSVSERVNRLLGELEGEFSFNEWKMKKEQYSVFISKCKNEMLLDEIELSIDRIAFLFSERVIGTINNHH